MMTPEDKSVVTEEYAIDAVGFDDIIHFEEDLLLVDKEVAEEFGREKNCGWKKRPLMVATSFLNIRMNALMLNLQMYE